MNITNYHIEMLDVGAADAFIIYFTVENDCKKEIIWF